MARTTRVVLICDLHDDGTEAVATITVDTGSGPFELDLCPSHLDELTKAGRPRSRPRKAARSTPAKSKAAAAPAARRRPAAAKAARRPRAQRDPQTALIREWARANGYTVNTRGRIPAPVAEAFAAGNRS